MTHELKGWCRPRPLRVVFLVQDGEHAQLALDGIFADCYGRWGGRFSLIVPCVDGRISPNYWPWLESYDPDIVYSYVRLSGTDVLEIHERLSPADYVFHELGNDPRIDVFGFKPRYDFRPLSSLSVVFRMARYSGAPVNIVDSWHTETPSRFLTDNLGTYHYSCAGGIFPPDATSAASLLTIVSPDKYQDRKYGVPRDLNMVTSESIALMQFATRKATSLSLLSSQYASKLEIHDHRWSGSFNLVVGDSFADRILFWNARLLIPAWLDSDLCCFRVNLEQLKDPEFLTQLGNLINHRNHVNGGSGGQTQLTLRSASQTSAQLADVLPLLQSAKVWSAADIGDPVRLDDLVPSAGSLKTARETNRFVDWQFKHSSWTTFPWIPPIARPPVVEPDHLSDAPVRQAFVQGYWCTDFSFEYDGPSTRFAETNRWMLPHRWRMAGAFKITSASRQPHSLPLASRRSRNGNLGVFVCAANPIEQIEVPTVDDAIRFALAADGRYFQSESEGGKVWPKNHVQWSRESNEARYLNGILGMTGGLLSASHFLLHPFLKDMFARLGGAPNLADTDISATVNALVKRARGEASFDLRSTGEREALASLIVKAARSVKAPMNFVSYDELKEQWKEYRDRYWSAHPSESQEPDDGAEWDEREVSSLDHCLGGLRHGKLLFQGHQWTCRNCHHKNWVDLGALSLELSCEVCKQSTPTPVNMRWQFRPNEFLIESLHAHSVLSLVWVLSALRDRARSSFSYAGPTCFGYSNNYENPDAEADLLALVDGEAVLCEVKSAWRSLRPSHIDDLVALATRLRPDTAMLAVMEEGTNLAAKLGEARALLAARGIKFELLTPAEYKVDDDPFL